MEDIALEVTNISKIFKLDRPSGISNIIKKRFDLEKNKKLTALSDVSFVVKSGEILGIIGKNGSGKSTLLRVIAGVYKPNIGSITVNGSLSPLLQLGAGFHLDLNARENIIINGMLLGAKKSEIEKKVNKVIKYAELENFVNMKLKQFSSGMRARLAFSTAMQIDPDILLVDEILSVGDKDFQKKSYETFLQFKKNKRTILHATHNLSKLSEYSDRVLLLDKGRVVMIGEPTEVIEKYTALK